MTKLRASIAIAGLVIVLFAAAAEAGPAIKLGAGLTYPPSSTPVPTLPPPVPYAGYYSYLIVAAIDAGGQLDTNFTGTVSMSTSDPLAILPPPHTFGPQDPFGFVFTPIFRTLGPQTVTFRDVAGNLIPVTLNIDVLAPSPTASVPTVSPTGWVVFGALLALGGAYLARR